MILEKKIKIAMFFVFTSFIGVSSLNMIQESQKAKMIDTYIISQKEKDIQTLDRIVKNTSAEGVVVYDLNNRKIIVGKNIDKTYSLASLTKIITANLAYEKDKNLLNEISDMLKTSSNTEADKISSIFGNNKESQIQYMNDRTEKYKLSFRNASGLDEILGDNSRLAGGEGKPEDMINFIKDYYLLYPEIFDKTLEKEDNTNPIIDQLKFVSASKTGYTDLSGGNLFISIQVGLGREVFILVLNSTEKNRFVDVQNIANFLLQSSI